jgi:hypothetical protein
MYSSRSGLVLGFHGCDESIAKDVLSGKKQLNPSNNSYDWLGHGMYFWENSPSRANDYAKLLSKQERRQGGTIVKPSVIGAVIDLGRCLDLLDYENLSHLKDAHEILVETIKKSGFSLPQNRPATGSGKDLLLRDLDCAVIETLHQVRAAQGLPKFDSVRGVFWEGKELYPDAGFREKDHIQICIVNPNCIKGYFVPRKISSKFPSV